ncbi:hypothetical protein [Caulobacter sp. Root1472]|uniref:hypothetical protein n=1 Tax=Caulobacter sp. Root1472 TaxID=1736470 RepID=UPI000A4095B7|nr:hypothetical protein [Caulobacter sp. Root1472]
MSQSSQLAAGAGFTFEDAVTARYLTGLLARGPAPGVEGLAVVRVAQQQRELGESLDDVIVDFGAEGPAARLSLQVKSSLTLSDAVSNQDFRDIVRDSWATLQKADFRLGADRYGAAVGDAPAQKLRDMVRLTDLARGQIDPQAFAGYVGPAGAASAGVKAAWRVIATVLDRERGTVSTPEELHRFLLHFVLIRFDFGHAAAVDTAAIVSLLQPLVEDGAVATATLLLNRLGALARAGGAVSRVFDRAALLGEVAGLVRLVPIGHLRGDLQTLAQLVEDSLATIQDDVQAAKLERPRFSEKIDQALQGHRLVRLRGLPGSGKSVVLRRQVEAARRNGPVLFLKADMLEHRSWTAFASAVGLKAPLRELLAEIAATGTAIFFLDGADRVERDQRPIVEAVLRLIAEDPDFAHWRVVTSLRDSGVEPVRTWMPSGLAADGVGDVAIDNLDHEEASALAALRPHLQPLLFGADAVREIARRPFFAKVLAQGVGGLDGTATGLASESDLIDYWWRRGGFDAEGGDALRRQRALIALSQTKLSQLSAPIMLRGLGAETIDQISPLEADGLLAATTHGHAVRFTHDIFFEWSLLHVLIDHEANWPLAVRAAGEPPAIGRVVELLAQRRFVDDEDWAGDLARLEQEGMRSQWTRAWLLGPLLTPRFDALAVRYAQTVLADDARWLKRALVWFQAEKTTPHPQILDGRLASGENDPIERARLADLLGWPSDPASWARLIRFLVACAEVLPKPLVGDVVAIFEVWQNLLAGLANPISDALLGEVDRWLGEIEAFQDQKPSEAAMASPWNGQARRDLVQALRTLLLRSAVAAPDRVAGYLARVNLARGQDSHRYEDIIAFAPTLAKGHAHALVDVTLARLKGELPQHAAAREDAAFRAGIARRDAARAIPEAQRTQHEQLAAEGMFHSFGVDAVSDHDWRALAIDGDQLGYFPASPLREPFHSLFRHAPEEALRLVADLSRHAMTAWRQLYRLDREHPGTPIPIDITFAWGTQRFWGGPRIYAWHRGGMAPPPLDSAYAALDAWAIGEVDKGRAADAIIAEILADNDCVAVLGVALAVAHHAPEPPLAIWPIVTTQRLWDSDRQRLVADMTGSNAYLIGFEAGDEAHIQALQAARKGVSRQREIRHLAASFVLSADQDLAARTRQAISAFADDPPFELEEERNHDQARAEAKRQALANAAWGDLSRYRRGPDPEAPEGVAIYGPQTAPEETPQQVAERRRFTLTHHVLQWADKALAAGQALTPAQVEEVLGAARELDHPGLFIDPPGNDEVPDAAPGAVTSLAAVLIRLAPAQADAARTWARAVLERAASAPEHRGLMWSPTAMMSWHAGGYAAQGLAEILRADPQDEIARRLLLGLVAHPLQAVSLGAIAAAFDLWDQDPRLGWCALGLGLGLCNFRRVARGPSDPIQSDQERADALARALAAYAGDAPWPSPPLPESRRAPVPVPVAQPARRGLLFVQDVTVDSPAWNGSQVSWYGKLAAQMLEKIPVAKVLISDARAPFMDLVEALLGWTIDRLTPQEVEGQLRRNPSRGSLYEWIDTIAKIAGRACGALEVEAARARFLDPILALPDEPRQWLLGPFVELYLAANVLDAPKPPPRFLELLQPCLDSLLSHYVFKRGGYSAGELRNGQGRLVRALMFIEPKASGAVRFANDDWTDIALILPLVQNFVRDAGWAASIAGPFLTLCERAKAVFPAETFADLWLPILQDPDTLAGWRGTMIQARIAGMVQHLVDREPVLSAALSQKFLRLLDCLIDMGDRRSAALQQTEAFREVRLMPALGVNGQART